MNPALSRIMIFAGPFLITLASGIWLSRSGKPYKGAIFNVHKLIALATVVILGLKIYPALKSADPGWIGGPWALLSGLLLAIVLIITGGLLSLEKPLPAAILRAHQAGVVLAVIASALVIRLFFVELS
jgi:hypothetical protein